MFYQKLFFEYPFIRALFPDDMENQIIIFSRTIDALVDNAHQLDRFYPSLADLAKRHIKYGVKVAHYAAVGAVLIDTFSEISGNQFTTETRLAWEAVYADTAGVMISSAYAN